MKPFACTTRADAFGDGLVLRASGRSGAMTQEERRALLSEVRSNPGTTATLRAEAITYLQPEDKPNRNHVRFSPKKLKAFAASFAGAPFLRNHDQDDIGARGGTVIESELIEHKGAPAIRQVLELVKPWAIEGVLDGTIDRFSIGWRAGQAPVICTGCKAEYATGIFGRYPSCGHYPGDTVKLKDGDEVIAEMEYTNAEGTEVSAVSVPAVVGTGVDEIRAALSASCAEHRSNRSATDMLKILIPILALSAEADESAVVTAIEKLKTESEGSKAALKDALAREVELKEKISAQEKLTHGQLVKAAIDQALAEKRLKAGGNAHAHAQKLAARGDLEGLQAYIADFPPGSAGAIGESPVTLQSDPTARTALATEEAEAARLLGKTADEFTAIKQRRAARLAAGK